MAQWHFRNLHPNDNSGTSTVEDNFANEERTSIEILVRETLQNPLDARNGEEIVRVRYNVVTVDRASSVFAQKLFSPEFEDHASAGKLKPPEGIPDRVDFLIVEDFGTSGLEGCYTDSETDGTAENWNAFWFREGEGAKPTKSNGGAGQGKVTLYTSSRIRTVLALTRRASDSKTLLFGCCKFSQNYKRPNSTGRWAKEALWGVSVSCDKLAVPIEDPELLGHVQAELKLSRGTQSGTSFIVPLPHDISLDAVAIAVVNEFYYPIKRGRLVVEVGEVVLDAISITVKAKEFGTGVRHAPQFLAFIDSTIAGHIGQTPTATAKLQWSKDSKLSDDCFETSELAALKKSFENSDIVSVDFPVTLKKLDPPGSSEGLFRVVLMQDIEADQSHELFIRRDLCIDGEKRLKGSRRIQPAIALTLIDDIALSSFLAVAEEPTHRTWNARRRKLIARYGAPEKVLNAVRNAALRLVELLTPAGKRDETALSIYFADPLAPPAKRKGAAGKSAISPIADPPETPVIPPPKPKLIDLVPLTDGFKVRLKAGEDTQSRLPLVCHVEVAYATTFGDPFAQWDAAEFWLNDERLFPATIVGIENFVRGGNEVSFELTAPESEISMVGFDSNRQLEVRLNYREAPHATDITDH